MTTNRTIRIDFDTKTYPYQILNGTLSSGGNSGRCIDGGKSTSTLARIKLKLPTISVITSVRLDWWKEHPIHQNLQTIVQFLDTNNQLVQPQSVRTYTAPVQQWATELYENLFVSNVKYVVFAAGASQGGDNLHARIDNCVVHFYYAADSGSTLSNTGSADCSSGVIAGEAVLIMGGSR
jgi:hypothetical protein